MLDRKYNGWANYETWLVNLWIGNDEGEHLFWIERAQVIQGAYELGQDMKAHYESEEIFPIKENGLYQDLLKGALSAVDWHEIARHFIEENEPETVEG